jgi:membrane protease YdiL (CAAX protease family)
MKHAKGIVVYLALTFGIAWAGWEILLRLGVPANSPMFQLVLLPGAFVPAVAAIVVRKWITREGFADAGLRPNLRHWRYYLIAWLLPLPVVATIVGLAMVLGVGSPDFTLQRAAESLGQENVRTLGLPPGALWPLLAVQGLIGSLFASLILWGEEFGWRGYLQVRLLADRPLAAAVVTGLIWGVWHYPVNLRGYNFPDHPYLGLLIFPVGTVLLSIILGWLRLRTGSVWAPSLCHAAFNAMAGSFTVLLFTGGANWLYVNPLGLLGWVPLGALCAWIVLTGQLRVRAPGAPAVPMAGAGELA